MCSCSLFLNSWLVVVICFFWCTMSMSVLIAIAKSIQLEDLKLLSTSQNLFRTSELIVTTSKVYFSTSSVRKYWIPWCKDLCWISKHPKFMDSTDGLLLKIILYNMPHIICGIWYGSISLAAWFLQPKSTLVTDVGDKTCWWIAWDVSNRVGCFDRQRTHSEDVTNKIIVSPTSKFCQDYCGLLTCLNNILRSKLS